MIARVLTSVPIGFNGEKVVVECDMTKGLPAFNIVGLADKSVAESRERVRSAITNSGFTFPAKRITINLAPASLNKEGSHLDLPIATSILVASGQLNQSDIEGVTFVGELSLNGDLRPVRGSILMTESARNSGCRTIILPKQNSVQAALINDIDVVGATTITDVVLHLLGEKIISSAAQERPSSAHLSNPSIDEVRGQDMAKRALVIAAAGHHNLLFTGPPGAGKTMLARTLPGLLPQPETSEIIETTKIHSLSDGSMEEILLERPFRSPHHTASFVALIGGGAKVRPGEVSLAHNGVLFLDEIPEFPRTSLEALRQPLEDHLIHISRANGKASYPAHFMLVATMNPCPCGYFGDDKKACACSQQTILNYQKRLSGPLLDRIDMIVPVARVARDELFGKQPAKEKSLSDILKKQIMDAHTMQKIRQQKPNSALGNRELEKFAALSPEARTMLSTAAERLNLSARGHFKTLRVARTVADLNRHQQVETSDVAEALRYRQ